MKNIIKIFKHHPEKKITSFKILRNIKPNYLIMMIITCFFNKAEVIDSSAKNDVRFTLYKLYSFFVEVAYSPEDNWILDLSIVIDVKN